MSHFSCIKECFNRIALLKQYSWEADPSVSLDDVEEEGVRPEALVVELISYETECLDDIRAHNDKIAKYTFQYPNPNVVERLKAAKKDITDLLANYVDTIWSRLQKEGTSSQAMLLFNKEPQVELNMTNLAI